MKATSDIPDDPEGQMKSEAPEAWLRSWLDAADEAVKRAPAGRPAREELAADRNARGT